MLCPKCGEEMKAGYLYGKVPVFWSASPHKRTLLRGGEDVPLFGTRELLRNELPRAWLCRACQCAIVEY